MQIYKHSLRKIEISYIVAFSKDTIKLPIYKLHVLNISTPYFYSSPALDNSSSVVQKVHDFRYRR